MYIFMNYLPVNVSISIISMTADLDKKLVVSATIGSSLPFIN